MVRCPCGSGLDLEKCCGPFVSGDAFAPTAEALMRSRFTAFSLNDMGYIARTYASEARDRFSRSLDTGPDIPVEWISLEILATSDGREDDNTGTVDFAAHFRKDGEAGVHREKSNFRREGGRWVYVDGDVQLEAVPATRGKTGRNQPCPCGSGRKFKKCCGR